MYHVLSFAVLLGASASMVAGQYSPSSPAATTSVTSSPSAQQGWQQVFSGLTSMSSGYIQQGQQWGQQVQSELSQLSSYSPAKLEQYVDQYQQQYCTPASITPEMKMPGNYTGTSIVLSFQLGNCTFGSDWTTTKQIECQQPSLVYIKSPAVLTAPYKTPVSFTDQECKISKSFGSNETQEVPAAATPTVSITIPTVSSVPATPAATSAPSSAAATAATGGTATGAASG
ncbi:hypothetical protein WJX84_010458 [Apatococcus fuscideae]|uniref:Uncharacterized protein n=1 Tax=Apatococcus fuscideae TaxID=2026836 RepID=A0AAW1TFP3_9CHLO